MSTLYHKKGLPDDLLTSTIEGEREIKVSPVGSDALEVFLTKLLLEQKGTNERILRQLELLNLRFEETFNTKLGERDL